MPKKKNKKKNGKEIGEKAKRTDTTIWGKRSQPVHFLAWHAEMLGAASGSSWRAAYAIAQAHKRTCKKGKVKGSSMPARKQVT